MVAARYLTLDAMRGIAALAVVSTHYSAFFGGPSARLGFLAVDVFFLLSGFVLAQRYDRDFASGSLRFASFMRKRIKRLAPLFYLGAALGVAAQFMRFGLSAFNWPTSAGLAVNALDFPSPFADTNGNIFPLNNPFWSLFLELWVANLLYGAFWKRIGWVTLAVLVGLGAAGLIWVALTTGQLSGGWTAGTLHVGLFRVIFSFFGGVGMARLSRKRPFPEVAPGWLILAVLLVFLLGVTASHSGAKSQLLSVLLGFPLLIYFGVKAKTSFPAASRLLGDASYAAYTIHFPLLWMLRLAAGQWARSHAVLGQTAFIVAIIAISIVAAAWDERIRGSARRIGASRLCDAPPNLSENT